MEDRWYLAALLRCPQVGSVRMQRLQKVCPAAKDVWSMTAAELRATGALTDAAADALARHIQGDPNLPERIAEDCRRADVSMVTMAAECYPLVLREIFDPPLVLYYRGTLLPDARRIGIVGARKFSGYGEAAALEFAEHLAAAGVTVVSGAARGIDTRAHRGAVLSEYAPGTQPLPMFFPARNRIISGLAEGVLVVEAARRSGSLITAEMALSEGREVYAIPGSIYSPQSGGCHNLIRAGARLVESPREILEEMHLAAPQRRSARAQLTPEEAHVYQVLSFDHALTMDEIIDSLPVSTTTSLPLLLLQMQLKGVIIENEMHAYRRAERN